MQTSRAFAVLVLVLAAIATASADGPRLLGRELARLDCTGRVTLMPDSFLHTEGAAVWAPKMIAWYKDALFERVKCVFGASCDMTDAHMEAGFWPSVQMIRNLFQGGGGVFPWDALTCEDNANAEYSRVFTMLQSFLEDVPGPPFRIEDMPTCSFDDILNGRTSSCRWGVRLPSVDMVINVALEQCPGDSSAFPFVSVTCKGDACDSLGKPCAGSTECGGDLVCEAIDIPDVNWMDSPFFAHYAPLDDEGRPEPCGINDITLKLVNFWRGLWGLDATDDDSSMSACVPDRAQAPWFSNIIDEVAHANDWVDDDFEDNFCYVATHTESGNGRVVQQSWNSDTFSVKLSELMEDLDAIVEGTLSVDTPWYSDCVPTVTINGTELTPTFLYAPHKLCDGDKMTLMFHNPPLLEPDMTLEVHFCPGHNIAWQQRSDVYLESKVMSTRTEWDCPSWVGSPTCINYASLSVVHDKQVTGEVFQGSTVGMFFAYANSHAEADCMLNAFKQVYPDCAAGTNLDFERNWELDEPRWHRVEEVNGVFKAEWDSSCPGLDVVHDVLQCPTRDHEVQHMMYIHATNTYYCMAQSYLEHNLTVHVPKNGFTWSTARVSGTLCALHFEVNGVEMPLKAANGEPLALPVCGGEYSLAAPLQLLDTSFFADHKGEDVLLRIWQEDVSCCDGVKPPLNLEVEGAFDVADHEEAMYMREHYRGRDGNVVGMGWQPLAVGGVTTTNTGISMDIYLGGSDTPPTTYPTGKVEIAMPEEMRTCYASAFKALHGVRPHSDYRIQGIEELPTQSALSFGFTLYDYDVNGGVATRLREDGLSDVFVFLTSDDDEQEFPVVGSLVVVEDTGTWPQYRNVDGLDPIVLTPDPFVPNAYAATGALVNITLVNKRLLMPADVHGNWLEDYARVAGGGDTTPRLRGVQGYYPQYETIDLHVDADEFDSYDLFTWAAPLVRMCGRVAPSHDLRQALRRANPLACMSVEENDGMFERQDGTTVDVTSTAFLMGEDLAEPPAPNPMPGHNGALARMECDGTVVVMDEYFHRTWVRLPKVFEHALTFVEGFFTDQAQCGLQFGGHTQLTEAQLNARFFPWRPEFWLYQYVANEPAFDAGSTFVADTVSEMPPAPGKLDNGGCSVGDYVAAGNMCKMGLNLAPMLEGKLTMEFGGCAGKVWPHLEFAVEGDDVNKYLRPSLCNEDTPCDAARFPVCPGTDEKACLNIDALGYTGQGMAGAVFVHPFASDTTCNAHEGWITEFGKLLQMEAQVEPTYTATSLGVCVDRDLTTFRDLFLFDWPLFSVRTDAHDHHTVQVAGLVDEDTPPQCGDINSQAVHDLLASFKMDGRQFTMEQNTMPSLWYMKLGLRPHGCATRFAMPPTPLWFSDELLHDGRVKYYNPAHFDTFADPGVEYDLVLTAVDRCLQESDAHVETVTPVVTPDSCNGEWDYGNGKCICSDGFTGPACRHCVEGHYSPDCIMCPGVGDGDGDGQHYRVCNDHGQCDDGRFGSGVCTCEDGYRGFACTLCKPDHFGAACTACACPAHSTCDDTMTGSGNCTCNDGFTGDQCQHCEEGHFGPNCRACNCGEHGTCDESDGSCKCDDHWDGETCSSCAVHWTGDDCDVCAEGYFGAECAACTCMHGTCADGLQGNGKCTGDCEEGWTGDNCDACADGFFGDNCEPCSCSEHGTCDEHGVCQCTGNWAGDHCDHCKTGWAGDDCAACADDYFGAECAACTCMHGTCADGHNGNGKCTGDCEEGWTGDNCDACADGFYGNDCHPCSCSEHGTCNADGSCRCTGHWAGALCDRCADAWAGPQCDECADGYFGAECAACTCEHGHCSDGTTGTGKCLGQCTSSAWKGENCDQCASNYYGESCTECSCVWGKCADGRLGDGHCTCDHGAHGTRCDKCRTGFTGEGCASCEKGYVGPDCIPCPDCVHGDCDDMKEGAGCICTAGWTTSPAMGLASPCTFCAESFYGPNCDQCYCVSTSSDPCPSGCESHTQRFGLGLPVTEAELEAQWGANLREEAARLIATVVLKNANDASSVIIISIGPTAVERTGSLTIVFDLIGDANKERFESWARESGDKELGGVAVERVVNETTGEDVEQDKDKKNVKVGVIAGVIGAFAGCAAVVAGVMMVRKQRARAEQDSALTPAGSNYLEMA